MSVAAVDTGERSLRGRCRGLVPLSGRLEPWQRELCRDPSRLTELLDEHGSPVNLIDPSPMARNAAELADAARGAGVALRVFFARKANKALGLIDEAKRLGLGVDVASERELAQTLARGVEAADIVVTAAVKPAPLLTLCLESGATVVVDNDDEIDSLSELVAPGRGEALVALRLAPELPGDKRTRFGFAAEQLLDADARLEAAGLGIDGLHFHLDGYDAGERLLALGQSLELIDRLTDRGRRPRFVDIGGGIPMSYLDSEQEWREFWREHRRALEGGREPLTFEGHGLGLTAHDGEVLGKPNTYPYFQRPVRGAWLAELLESEVVVDGERSPAAAAISGRGLELRCEPGRSLLDGAGMTVARVMFTKRVGAGDLYVGLAMNRTQCRSTSDDFLVDPLLVPAPGRGPAPPADGFLVGAYCIERELLTWRRLVFPEGVAAGDVVGVPEHRRLPDAHPRERFASDPVGTERDPRRGRAATSTRSTDPSRLGRRDRLEPAQAGIDRLHERLDQRLALAHEDDEGRAGEQVGDVVLAEVDEREAECAGVDPAERSWNLARLAEVDRRHQRGGEVERGHRRPRVRVERVVEGLPGTAPHLLPGVDHDPAHLAVDRTGLGGVPGRGRGDGEVERAAEVVAWLPSGAPHAGSGRCGGAGRRAARSAAP